MRFSLVRDSGRRYGRYFTRSGRKPGSNAWLNFVNERTTIGSPNVRSAGATVSESFCAAELEV